jgi:hypothetical protein
MQRHSRGEEQGILGGTGAALTLLGMSRCLWEPVALRRWRQDELGGVGTLLAFCRSRMGHGPELVARAGDIAERSTSRAGAVLAAVRTRAEIRLRNIALTGARRSAGASTGIWNRPNTHRN